MVRGCHRFGRCNWWLLLMVLNGRWIWWWCLVMSGGWWSPLNSGHDSLKCG
ncbi:hypothetical protein HanIR_Chr08g0359931 [Helianthus annuus]|nr:hypothetical protein HanIR_Chr08g0359931 [Helianthus annuus]